MEMGIVIIYYMYLNNTMDIEIEDMNELYQVYSEARGYFLDMWNLTEHTIGDVIYIIE